MGVKLREYELLFKAKDFAKAIWNEEFNLRVDISGKMTRTLGFFKYYKSPRKPICLQFAARLIAGDYNENTIDEVIKHELTHWHMFMNNLPCNDGDYEFEKELKRIGSHSTRTIQPVGELHICKCSKCNKVVAKTTETRAKNLSKTTKKVSSCCRARIYYAGTEYHEDKTPVSIPRDKEIAAALSELSNQKVVKVAMEEAPVRSIETIIEVGRRGVTNAQMIPALKKAISEHSVTNLNYLRITYPAVYESSLKYLAPKLQDRIKELMGK